MTEIDSLKNKAVAIIATDGFEEIELTAPKSELEHYGVKVHIISEKQEIKSWKNKQWSGDFFVDILLDNAHAEDYNALIIPGGVINADRLRRNTKVIEFIKEFDRRKKIIAAICHGPQLLIEAGLVKGKNMTSHNAIKTDMINAGAHFEDYGVTSDGNYITAQGVDDISSFLKKIIGMLEIS